MKREGNTLLAGEGKLLTNGQGSFGPRVDLPEGADGSEWFEVDEEQLSPIEEGQPEVEE